MKNYPLTTQNYPAELWPLIDVDWDFYEHLASLRHEKRCSRAIVRSSDNSSFSQVCNRLVQIFVSAQYLENKLNEFDQILYMYSLTLT